MNRSFLGIALRTGALLCAASLASTAAFPQSINAVAESTKPVISLVSETPNAASSTIPGKGEASFANAPVNFHSFASASVGEDARVEYLTLHFAASTKLTEIKSSKDFQVEQGGSCMEEVSYSAGETCVLLVRFTPLGPGPRLGKLTITHSASAQPFSIGLGGNGYAPVVSFTPALISTVPGTYVSGAGLLNGAKNLTIDGGDTLYVADTGNNLIRSMDSSGTIRTLASGYTAPLGIAVDNFGEVYFDLPATNLMYEIYDYGPVVQVNGTGTASCPASTPCNLSTEALGTPGMMSMDAYNHLFFADDHLGAAFATVQPLPAKLVFLYDPFPYQTNPSSAIAADASDNIYSLWSNGGECEIVKSTLYDAENSNVIFTKIVGGHTCGFSGDGGEAGNAEIRPTVGQMAFDVAGDFYFSDTNNQRVRRIENNTGIIRTIAGNGTAGYTGDGGKATSAALNNPTGLAVDSQGAVYIISGATGSAQVIRKVGPQGFVAFGNQGKGSASAPQSVTVTNTGNTGMLLTNVVITGANPTDFKIDNTTTNCMLTPGASLAAGETCRIGVIFTPLAVGALQATLTLLDNTVNGADSVTLSGTGVLQSPIFKITSPANGSSFKSGTPVTFSVSVTSSSGPQPTGTVQFKVDGANHGSAVNLSATGAASTSVTGLTTTNHTLSATYSGDANYAAAGPISVPITITAAAIVKFTAPLPTPALTPKTDMTLAVTVTATTGPAPTGKVNFSVDGKFVATATIVSGKASVNAGILAAGTHTAAATYSGDKYHPASNASEKFSIHP
jgi:hypothetical protein